jgi:hypothetical protein
MPGGGWAACEQARMTRLALGGSDSLMTAQGLKPASARRSSAQAAVSSLCKTLGIKVPLDHRVRRRNGLHFALFWFSLRNALRRHTLTRHREAQDKVTSSGITIDITRATLFHQQTY